ncbi:MAG: hypothetical protein L0216_04760, partial [Planctomycetales bacterium]|nr:hypothetical protein [Planctomycetales bacterium]
RRAAGVRLEGGEVVRARCVASNADARTTFLKLVGRERLPPRFVARLEAMRPSISCVQVYASWDEDLRTKGVTDHMIFVNPSYDPEAEWEATRRGEFEKAGFGITVYTNMDPATPPGTGSVAALTCLAPYDLPGGWGDERGRHGKAYGDLKRALADRLVERAARIAPALAAPTRTRDVATPLTLERYTGNTAGAMYGWENSPDQSGLHRLRRHPVRGLHLVGHWTFPSSGYTGVLKSAEFQAARILAGFGRRLPEGGDGGCRS